jgi:methionyl-tRNA synthetase
MDGDISKSTFDEVLVWRDSWQGLSERIGDIAPLFPRIETDSGQTEQTQPPGKHARKKVPAKGADLLGIEDFKRLDLRVAHVKSASMVQGAKKLLKLEVDIGGEERQIVAGIAEHYAPEELTGKNIVVIANLKPAKIRGVESRGMLLAATDGDKVIVLVPDKEASPGSKIS